VVRRERRREVVEGGEGPRKVGEPSIVWTAATAASRVRSCQQSV
jgi:hypothetical protein